MIWNALYLARLVPRSVWIVMAALLALGAVYTAGKWSAEDEQEARDADAIRSRLETDDAVRDMDDDRLCRELGGGVLCDQFGGL